MNKRQLNNQPKSAGRGGAGSKRRGTEEERVLIQSENLSEPVDDADSLEDSVGIRARMSSF